MTSEFEIRINTSQLTSYSAGLRREIGDKYFELLLRSYASYIRNLYLGMIEESINSKRYEGLWEPIDEEEYLKYIGTKPVGNIFELIKDSMEIEKEGYYIVVRIDSTIKYPGSHMSLVQVLKSIEYGTSKFNARPIFRTIVKKLKGNILPLWRGYLSKKGIR